MRYKLRETLVLRGWDKLPYAVQDTSTGHTEFLDELAFRALTFCDGQMDADSPLLLPAHREIISKLARQGAVVPCRPGDGLRPHQKYRLFPSRYIRTAQWSVTGRCNYKCRHCCMSAPDAKYGELSHEQCMDIIDQLQGCGIRNVLLTGGEALVRSDFWEIVDRLIAYGIRIRSIYSNGRLVTPETLDALERRGIYPEISMSFDGLGWHDWMRGVEGAERDVAAALDLCRERGFSTRIEMCLHRRNRHTLRGSVNFLASKGVRELRTSPAFRSGAWIENAGADCPKTTSLRGSLRPKQSRKPCKYVYTGLLRYARNDESRGFRTVWGGTRCRQARCLRHTSTIYRIFSRTARRSIYCLANSLADSSWRTRTRKSTPCRP